MDSLKLAARPTVAPSPVQPTTAPATTTPTTPYNPAGLPQSMLGPEATVPAPSSSFFDQYDPLHGIQFDTNTPSQDVKQIEQKAEASKEIARFGLLPLAGAPLVSGSADKTLGNMDPIAKGLTTLEEKAGPAGQLVAKGGRLFTRVSGPGMYAFSAFLDWKRLPAIWKNPQVGIGGKLAETAGTVGITVGAAASALSTMPAKLLNVLKLGTSTAIAANKVSGIAGGIGSMFYSTENLITTLKNKNSKPAQRMFAKLSFGLGAVGFIAGTTALAVSMPNVLPVMAQVASKLPWLLPTATKIATACGIGGLISWGSQNFLGNNSWLNKHLKGFFLA